MRQKDLTLDELLADPIVRQVMRRDGVREEALRALMRQVGERLAERGWSDGSDDEPSDWDRPTQPPLQGPCLAC